MLGAIDLTTFDGVVADLALAIPLVGAALVTTYVLTKTFGFVIGWASKLFAAGRGRATG